MGSGDRAGRQITAEPVVDYISGQLARLHDAEHKVRAREPDGVHDMRVAVRRLRSVLVVYGSMFEESLAEPLAGELRWLGQTLAPARDLEVIRDRLVAAINDDPRLGGSELPGYLARPLTQAQEAAHDQLIEALDSPRGEALQVGLSELRPEPPGVTPGFASTGPDVRRLAASTWSDLRTCAAKAAASTVSHERDEALHELRKAAKRVRYALELVTGVDDQRRPEDRRTLTALRDLQQVLGEHHDTVATRDWLKGHPPSTAESHESAVHARLLEHEQRAAQRCEQEYEPILLQALPD